MGITVKYPYALKAGESLEVSEQTLTVSSCKEYLQVEQVMKGTVRDEKQDNKLIKVNTTIAFFVTKAEIARVFLYQHKFDKFNIMLSNQVAIEGEEDVNKVLELIKPMFNF